MINVEKAITTIEVRIKGAGYSINDACFAAGFSRATFQNWKGGVHVPDINRWDTLHRIVAEMEQLPTDKAAKKVTKIDNMLRIRQLVVGDVG